MRTLAAFKSERAFKSSSASSENLLTLSSIFQCGGVSCQVFNTQSTSTSIEIACDSIAVLQSSLRSGQIQWLETRTTMDGRKTIPPSGLPQPDLARARVRMRGGKD